MGGSELVADSGTSGAEGEELGTARSLLAAGKTRSALAILTRLARSGPPRLAVWMPLIEAFILTGELGRAEGALGRLERSGVTGEGLDALRRRYRAAVRDRCGIRVTEEPHILAGWPLDCGQPALRATVQVHPPPSLDVAALERAVAEGFAIDLAGTHAEGGPEERVADLAVRLAVALQQAATLPVFESGRLIARGDGRTFTLIVPVGDDGAATVAVGAVLTLLTAMLGAGPRPADWQVLGARLSDAAPRLLDRLRQSASPTGNGIHYLRTAHRMGVPWRRYGSHVWQIGQGARSRWLDSSLTDRTPSLGVTLAQNKMATASILRRAGLPAPPHGRATTVEAARTIADGLGYPVVVKPINRDGGLGVAAGLEDEAALAQAFAATRELADEVLVEKHVEGDDYRLVVMGGRVTWAIERIPGGVRGDGRSTLGELLAAFNADPRRGEGKSASLQRVEWDEEAAHLAARQGLTLDAVPAADRFVRLRRITNVARGGTPVPFPLARIHPENIRLAIRAATALRLDLAGIDFITPDIGRPWHEVGGAINEVNARPSLGLITAGHLFGEIVDWLLAGGDGRIPIVAVVGEMDGVAEPLARRVHRMLLDDGLRAGLALGGGAWIGETQVAWDDRRGEAGGALLLTDPGAEAAVLAVPLAGLEVAGAPFDLCSVVVHLGGEGPPDAFEAGLVARATAAVVAPAGAIARLDGCGSARRIPVPLDDATGPAQMVDRLAAAVADALTGAAARR